MEPGEAHTLEQEVQRFALQHQIHVHSNGSVACTGSGAKVVKNLNLTRDYMSYRQPCAKEHAQNWIDQIAEQAGSRPATAWPQNLQVSTWTVRIIGAPGPPGSGTMFGWVAEKQQPRSLVLTNYGSVMSLDSMSLGVSTARGNASAAGDAWPISNSTAPCSGDLTELSACPNRHFA